MSDKADTWMPIYIGEYLADTSRLSTEQHGAYLLLIMDYWRMGPPPDDDEVLRQITKLSTDAWSNARAMLKHLFKIENGYWHHKRIDKELTRAANILETIKTRARVGAAARWAHKNNASSNAQAMPEAMHKQCLSDAPLPSPILKPIPIPLKSEKPTRKKTSCSLKTFIDNCKTVGEKPIPDDDPVIDYAEEVGIPPEFLWLQWREFIDRYKDPDSKQYKDWRIVFRKSVRGCWFKLWYIDGNGKYALTTTGLQAQLAHKAKVA